MNSSNSRYIRYTTHFVLNSSNSRYYTCFTVLLSTKTSTKVGLNLVLAIVFILFQRNCNEFNANRSDLDLNGRIFGRIWTLTVGLHEKPTSFSLLATISTHFCQSILPHSVLQATCQHGEVAVLPSYLMVTHL